MRRSTSFPTISQLRSLIFNKNTSPKNINRCKTNIVQNLPVEILVQIFDNIIPLNSMRICDEYDDFVNSCEVIRILLRLTCKRWNRIIINSINHASLDIYGIKKRKLEYVVPPPGLRKLDIIDSRHLHAYICDPPVLYSSVNESGINRWLTKNELKHVEKLYLHGCLGFSTDGLSSLYDQLIELSIVNCPQVTVESLSSMLMKLNNLESLTINTDKFFTFKLYEIIDRFLPKLNNLKLLIPFVSRLDRNIVIQLADLQHLPKSIADLSIIQQLPYDDHVLTSTPPPDTLKRLDVSNCFFLNNIFDIPRYLTHLTVSYPTLPRNTIKLPSTIEYLNVSGYIRNNSRISSCCRCQYSKFWINMFPDNAPIRTLILHLYACPKELFSAIVRYADTLRYLDCRILLLNTIDIASCEEPCHLGRNTQLETIQKLTNLTVLKFYCRLEDDDINNFPDSLKKLWLINEFNNQPLVDRAYRAGIQIYDLWKSY
ncbi:hypothetical protein RclHR1_00040017 [Rhizophagus clarus]|uniref:Uncharacterized protein n=1 Tax=Rhizophagus clarus TaxID=94130 RepID=A0A2Z6RE53_9GLOM|nr:hypothetical protein RclHR1_00040017 [Rhizophagus clarus]GES91707.1 hypothetical protein GLOIN_2v1480823 [Rhizophagus clarus]